MYGKPIQFGTRFAPPVTPRVGLRLAAVLVMCCAILVHISAMDETMEGRHQGENQSPNRVSADGAEATGNQPFLLRERRAVKNNATPSLSDFEKRLQAMEERYNFVSP